MFTLENDNELLYGLKVILPFRKFLFATAVLRICTFIRFEAHFREYNFTCSPFYDSLPLSSVRTVKKISRIHLIICILSHRNENYLLTRDGKGKTLSTTGGLLESVAAWSRSPFPNIWAPVSCLGPRKPSEINNEYWKDIWVSINYDLNLKQEKN